MIDSVCKPQCHVHPHLAIAADDFVWLEHRAYKYNSAFASATKPVCDDFVDLPPLYHHHHHHRLKQHTSKEYRCSLKRFIQNTDLINYFSLEMEARKRWTTMLYVLLIRQIILFAAFSFFHSFRFSLKRTKRDEMRWQGTWRVRRRNANAFWATK